MNIKGKSSKFYSASRVLFSAIISLSLLWQGALSAQASPAAIDGLVGTGTATSCTEAALDTALSGGGSVVFNCGPAPVTIVITSVKTIASDTTLDGAGLITISTLPVTPTALFIVNSGVTLRLQNLVLNGGDAKSGNGGALTNHGTANLFNVTLSSNHATNGGAIYNDGVLNLDSVTANGNTVTNQGGVLYDAVSPVNGAHVSQLTNVTFYGNTAPLGGGAIYNNQNLLSLTNATIDGNSADAGGSAIFNAQGGPGVSGTVNLMNTIIGPIALNSTPFNCSGTVTSLGHNLDTDGSCVQNQNATDLKIVSPVLGSLTNNGGPIQTQMLLNGSPAIDSGDSTHCPAVDQRGLPRPFGGGCDMGAVEVQTIYGPLTGPWYVSQAGLDSNPCNTVGFPCKTINGAIAKASANDNIYVAMGFYSSPNGNEVVNVSKNVQIEGGWNSAFTAQIGLSTIQGQVKTVTPPSGQRGVTIQAGVNAWMSGFTIQGGGGAQATTLLPSGSISGTMGGGLFVDGQLHASILHVVYNRADYGAGIEVTPNGSLYLSQSTVDNNEVSYTGGGINAQKSSGVVVDSTISNNILDDCPTCSFRGSELDLNYGTMLIGFSTIVSKFGTMGDATVAAIRTNAAKIGLLSTIVVGARPCEQGAFIITWQYNLESQNTCGLTDPTDHVNTDPLLGPLLNNGGFTPTHALPFYSPAVDAAGNCSIGVDQRGVARPQGAACDIGAYEYRDFSWVLLSSASSQNFPLGLGTISGGGGQGLYNGIIGVLLPAGAAPSGSLFEFTPRNDPSQLLPSGMQAAASFDIQGYTPGTGLLRPQALPSPINQLSQPMTLTLSYNGLPAGVPPKTLTLMWFNPKSQTWIDLPAAIDTGAHTVTVQTLHLGQFALAGGFRDIFIPILRK